MGNIDGVESFRSGIGPKLVVVMIFCSTALALVATLYELSQQYSRGVDDVKKLHSDMFVIKNAVLIEQVWSFNDAAAKASVEGLAQLGGIDRAELSWEDGSVLSSGKDIELASDIVTSNTLSTFKNGENYVLGQLRLYSSLDSLHQELLSFLGGKLLVNFFKSLFVSAVVLYFFNRLVTNHLRKIVRYTSRLNLGHEYQSLALAREGDQRDELDQLVSAINDMGERLQSAHLEAESRQVELEDLVQRRTKRLQIANEKLIEKSRLATIGMLVAMVAHELRNPLGTIKASLALLEVKSLDDSSMLVLKRANRNVDRCDETVEQLRRIGKKSVNHWVEFDLGQWLEEYVRDKLELDKRVNLKLNIVNEAYVLADMFQLEMVFRNLFENSQQAMAELPSGKERRIEVSVQSKEACVDVLVRDSGMGLDADGLERAFKPLYTTKQYGFGMGLALSRSLIESLGGNLTIESGGQMQGAVVSLQLPDLSSARLLQRQSESAALKQQM